MLEFVNTLELFIGLTNNLKRGVTNFNSPLEEMVVRASGSSLAYVDNRRDAMVKYGYDFWGELKEQLRNDIKFKEWIKTQGIAERLLYSKSEQFPDFLFKVRKHKEKLISGSLLELKDSKSGSIASFNSTLPTKRKSLEEINIINGGSLVSKITSVMDGDFAEIEDYYAYQRKSFYLVRTHKNKDKVKISVVDGSFFETVPKENLIYQMFMNILREHLEKREVEIPSKTLGQIKRVFSHITNQTIIAKSQNIDRASIRPRLRIMAEVHSEGNPHNSGFYPEILEQSLNLILKASEYEKEKVAKIIRQKIPEIKTFAIKHKRNGKHIVFQFKF
ncbi:hypothetical protein KAW65_01745 [candidate division WOR-3 bacterium]|nr:hypothetical protein [candidate division WOR-3 bacterium]